MSEPEAVARTARRHDMDALRAFAMLLGILLHGCMSFTGFPSFVQDKHTSMAFVLLIMPIHGFRMQLFMLVSGYFTMMVWRKRGLKSMLRQRFYRIFIPCVLGLVTVIPAMELAMVWASRYGTKQEAAGEAPATLPEAIRRHNMAALNKLIEAGADVNEADVEFKIPPLNWAALTGDADAAKMLIDHGADLNSKTADGNTALFHAAFLGQVEVIKLLIEKGADLAKRNNKGETAVDAAGTPMGATAFVANMLRIPLKDEEEIVIGREESLHELKKHGAVSKKDSKNEGWLDRARSVYTDFIASERFQTSLTRHGRPVHLVLTSVFHHLWFLWYLCWLICFFAAGAIAFGGGRKWGFPQMKFVSKNRLWWLAGITMLPQLFMGATSPSFGPDTSTGILPPPHLLAYYGIFFGVGALYFDCENENLELGKRWRRSLPLTLLVCFPLGMTTMSRPVIGGLVQVFYTWTMVFALMGWFQEKMQVENQRIRYLSDSAYWLYLAHMPVLIVLQGWVKNWDYRCGFKYIFICSFATMLLLVSYEYLVRHTWIGWLLNGKKIRLKHEKA